MKINYKIIAVVALVISIACLSIAYASFSSNLTINGTATVDSHWEIIWENMQDVNATGYAEAGSLEITDSDTNVKGNIGTLVAPGDSLVATWYVSNKGNINAQTTNITVPTLSCTPAKENGSTVEEANQVCNDTTLSIYVQDWGMLSTGGNNYGLTANSTKLVTMTLTYSDSVETPVSGAVEINIESMPIFEFTQMAKATCISKGSKITLENGKTKNIENIKVGESILAYDYYDGKLSPTKVYSIISGNTTDDIFKVNLENGQTLEIVGFEYLFDTDSKLFIPINNNTYKQAINKNIMINNNGNISSSKVISIDHYVKEVEYYTMYTEKVNNYIANNMIVHIHVNFVNDIFTINDNYKIDIDKYNKDIEKYGLLSYEDFKDVCSEEFFDMYDFKNYSIIIGKGLLSFEDLKNGIKEVTEEIDYYNNIK